jgi:hypothetical protein
MCETDPSLILYLLYTDLLTRTHIRNGSVTNTAYIRQVINDVSNIEIVNY